MKISKFATFDSELAAYTKDFLDIPKQYIHIPKLYSKNSPLRNKKYLLKVRTQSNNSFNEFATTKKSKKIPLLEDYFNKIISSHTSEKENSSVRQFSTKRQRILSELPLEASSFNKTEQEEQIKNYKFTQSKINSLTKCKLPLKALKFKVKKL